MADGKVVISTELDNSRIPAGIRAVKGALGGLKNVAKKMETTMQSALGSKDLELEARQMAEAVGELGTKAELAIQKQLAAFTKQNALYARQEKKVDVLKAKLSELSVKQVETDAFKDVNTEIADLKEQMDVVLDRKKRFLAGGGDTNSRTIQGMTVALNGLKRLLDEANAKKEALVSSGGAYQRADVSGLASQLEQEQEKLSQMADALKNSYSSLGLKLSEYSAKTNHASSATKTMSVSAGSLGRSIGGSVKNILKYAFGIQSLFAILNKLRGAMVDGFKNMSQFDGETNSSLSALSGSLAQLKNSLASAFAPILNVAAPALTTLIGLLSQAANSVAAFFAVLTGKSTFTKAVSVQKDYAASLNATGGAAKKASKSLAGFDEITRLSSDSSGGGGGGTSASDMFETEEVISPGFQAIADKIKELIAPLKEIDFGPAVAAFGRLKEAIAPLTEKLFEGLEWAWYNLLVPLASWTIEDAVPAFLDLLSGALSVLNSVLYVLQPLGQWLWDSFLQPLAEWTGMAIVDTLQWFSDRLHDISDWISENASLVETLAILIGSFGAAMLIVNGAVAAWNALAAVATVVTGAFSTATGAICWPVIIAVAAITALIAIIVLLVKNWDTVKDVASNVWDSIKATWEGVSAWFDENVVQPVAKFFTGMWESISNLATECWESIKEFFAPAVQWFSELFGSVSQTFSDIFYNIGVIASGCWEIIKAVWSVVSDWFSENITGPVSDFFTGMWEGLKEGAQEAWEGVKSAFSAVADFFGDIFSTAWEKVTEVFSPLGEIFVNIKDGILTAFKEIVNGIIGGLNSAISVPFSGINWALGKIRDVNILGLRPFSGIRYISVPQIPYLAQGAVLPANKPFLAMVGDQRNGTNVEAPLSTIQEAVALVMDDNISAMMAGFEAVVQAIREQDNSVVIGDDVIYRAADRYRAKLAVVRGGSI